MRSAATTATLLCLTLLGGCVRSESQQPTLAERTALDACRQHADQVYERLNRDQIYNVTNSARDSPSSGTYFSNNPSRGLTDRYSHDLMIQDCVRNAGTEAERAPAAGAATDPGKGVQVLKMPPPPTTP